MPGDPCNALVAVDGVVNIMAISVAMEVFALLTSAVALYGIAKVLITIQPHLRR